MSRKFWIPILSLASIVMILAGFFLARPLAVASASGTAAGDAVGLNQGTTTGTYYWSFAAKFVCGYQPPTQATGGPIPGEPVVKPGNYATEINIQNPNYKPITLIKHVIVLVDGDLVKAEPATAGPSVGVSVDLPGVFATLDACNNLYFLAHPGAVLTSPMPLFIGYLVILSPLDLNVNAVYTSNAPGVAGQTPNSNSIDVQPVTGKRVFVPSGVNP